MVALTGIEPEGWQFSPVQLSLSGCGFGTVGIPGCSGTPPRTADVTAQSQRSLAAPSFASRWRAWRGSGAGAARMAYDTSRYVREPPAARFTGGFSVAVGLGIASRTPAVLRFATMTLGSGVPVFTCRRPHWFAIVSITVGGLWKPLMAACTGWSRAARSGILTLSW